MAVSRQARFDSLHQALIKNPEGFDENRDMAFHLTERRDSSLLAEPYIMKALSHRREGWDTERLLYELAVIRSYRGDMQGMRDVYEILHAASPNNFLYLFGLGDATFRLGRIDEASDLYGRGVDVCRQAAVARSGGAGPPTQVLFPAQVICRSIGEMASKLDLFLKARELGLVDEARFLLLAPEGSVVNPCLLDCFADHIEVVRDEDAIRDAEEQFGACWHVLDYYRMPDGRCLPRDLAYAIVQGRWEEEGRAPLLRLSDEVDAPGAEFLRARGVPDDAWFVCLHIREPGHFGENVSWNHNRYRDVDIANYLPAIEAIVERGGWVLRIGSTAATPLPDMPGTIDCAADGPGEDWLDVFACARSRFFLGPDSGPYWIPGAFGVPIVGTDWFPYGVWPVSRDDLFILKPLVETSSGRALTIEEIVAPPFFGLSGSEIYQSRGLTVVDNTPDEIKSVAVEMMDRLDGTAAYTDDDDRLQTAFRRQADPYDTGAGSRIGRDFLRHHQGLLLDR
jgi:putative glycosyltransferase (TIGR04372 family)